MAKTRIKVTNFIGPHSTQQGQFIFKLEDSPPNTGFLALDTVAFLSIVLMWDCSSTLSHETDKNISYIFPPQILQEMKQYSVLCFPSQFF